MCSSRTRAPLPNTLSNVTASTGLASTPIRELRWRRDAARLTAGQLEAVRRGYRGMTELADERGYDFFAGLHGLPLPIECIHDAPTFLPWHRAFLYFFERALRDRSPEATLPWWNWATPDGEADVIPAAFADESADGAPNPLFSARVSEQAIAWARRAGQHVPGRTTFRDPGAGGRALPSKDQVDDLIAIRDFPTFSSELENLHGQVHLWTGGRGGHMRYVPWSSFDPVFWAHHCMVDRLWRLWQIRHNAVGPPEREWGQALPPFPVTVAQTLDVTRLGYDYASSTSSQTVEA